MKAIPLPHFKRKLNEIAKELYIEHDWKMPEGFRDTKLRNPLNFTRAEWEQAKRSGHDPKILKSMFQECWASSDNRESFSNALKENGFYLARGDRRGFLAVDHNGSTYSIPRFINKRTKEVKAKIGQSDELPSITETKKVVAQEMTNLVQKYIKEADNIYTQKSLHMNSNEYR